MELELKRYLRVHNLTKRLPQEELSQAVRVIGFKENLEVALAARVEGVTPEAIEELSTIKSSRYLLPQMWRLYAHSLAPLNEEELIEGSPLLGEIAKLFGLPLYPLYEEVKRGVEELLKKESLSHNQLVKEISKSLAENLPAAKLELGSWPSHREDGVTIGEEALHLLLEKVCLALPISLEEERGVASYHLFEAPQLGGSLAKEFLHAFGPANLEEFIAWSGVGATQGERLWQALDYEAVVQDPQGRLYLREDYLTLEELPEAEGVRLIGYGDPLFEIPHRSLLVQGKRHYNYFYRSTTPPGMLLSDGVVIAGWHLRQQRGSLSLQVEDIGLELGRVANQEIEEEVERLALAFGLKSGGFSVK